MNKIKIIICGDRNWDSDKIIRNVIEDINSECDDLTIIHGGCKGIDTLAENICRELKIETMVFKADWKKGRCAGPIRNIEMLKMLSSSNDIVLGFHTDISNSKGTKHMLDIAKKKGMTTLLNNGEETMDY